MLNLMKPQVNLGVAGFMVLVTLISCKKHRAAMLMITHVLLLRKNDQIDIMLWTIEFFKSGRRRKKVEVGCKAADATGSCCFDVVLILETDQK